MSGAGGQAGRRPRAFPPRGRYRGNRADLGFAKLTGHPVLGRLIGAPSPGKLYAIASRPAMGKTALALAVTLHVAERGFTVLYVSADMHMRVLMTRLLAAHSGISLQKLKTGELNAEELARAASGAESLKRLPLVILDAYEPMAWNELLEKIEQAMAESKSRLFVLDPLLQPRRLSPASRISWAGLASHAAGLRGLAGRTESIGLVACGMNRAIESRRERTPKASDLRGGKRLAKMFKGILFVERPDWLDRISFLDDKRRFEKFSVQYLELNGQLKAGTIMLRIDPESLQVMECDE